MKKQRIAAKRTLHVGAGGQEGFSDPRVGSGRCRRLSAFPGKRARMGRCFAARKNMRRSLPLCTQHLAVPCMAPPAQPARSSPRARAQGRRGVGGGAPGCCPCLPRPQGMQARRIYICTCCCSLAPAAGAEGTEGPTTPGAALPEGGSDAGMGFCCSSALPKPPAGAGRAANAACGEAFEPVARTPPRPPSAMPPAAGGGRRASSVSMGGGLRALGEGEGPAQETQPTTISQWMWL